MGFFWFFDLLRCFQFYWLWLKAVGFRLWWIFFSFSTSSFFSHIIGFALRQAGSSFDGFFLFFDFQLLLPFYCLWFMAVGFRLWRIFFGFSTSTFFSRFIAFALRPSGSDFDEFFLFFDLKLLFPFYFLWFKAVGFIFWWIFLFFDLLLLFFILLPLV